MAGKAQERVYVVENKGTGSKRLVQAKSQAAALNHVVDDVFDVRTVSTVEMGELLGKYKVQLEFAGQAPVKPPSALPSGGDLVDEVVNGEILGHCETPADPILNGNGENADPNADLPM